jgi:hypothetical protein
VEGIFAIVEIIQASLDPFFPIDSTPINYWISTIAKIPSTEQDGVFNVMSMGKNGSSLAWIWPG